MTYQGGHRPIKDADPLHALSSCGTFPKDVYKTIGQYAFGVHGSRASEVVLEYRGQPDAPVLIFRSVPPGVTRINHGDWVTLSLGYALQHGIERGDDDSDWPVISAWVKASDVRSGGNDIMEWGYWGPDIDSWRTFGGDRT